MKLIELLPLFIQRNRMAEKDMAEIFVQTTVNATYEEMLIYRVQLAQILGRSKRVDTYVSTVCVYAAGNHQYNRRVAEFETECRRRRANK